MAFDRGVYKAQGIGSTIVYTVYDSKHSAPVCRCEVDGEYSCQLVEDRIATWLDIIDPVNDGGITAPSEVTPPLTSPVHLVA